MSHQSESARTEQIIAQFQLKALQAILTSRIPQLARPLPDPDPTRTRKRDRWFNLALGDLPAALDNPSHGLMDPVVVDVILSPDDVILERWTTACEPPPPLAAAADGALYRRTYKKSIVLLRSLYSILRLLPCFQILKLLSASSQSYSYDLSYRVSSFAPPFSREEEKELNLYTFTPIETQFGYLSLSVSYRPSLSDFNLEVSSLIPPMIIADYVGSPAADPMRAFPSPPAHRPSGSGSRSRPVSYPLRGIPGSSSLASPSPPAYHRPHSWSGLRSAPIDVHGNRIPSQKAAGSHKKSSFSFDEFRLSPPFSNSPTPSPPTYGSSGNSMQARLRSETTPVSIPVGVPSGKSQLHRALNHSDPMRSFLPPPSPRSAKVEQVSHQGSPTSDSKSIRKLEGLKLADFYSNLAQKGLRDGRDDSGRFSGIFSSSGSPRFGFSRSSSRLSIQDDLDECDFSCPFAVDDVDTSDSQARNHDGKEAPEASPSHVSPHKSQDAAVGALVHMLRTAPPLRQDSYSSPSSRSEISGDVGNSSLFMSRKTSDAMEELRTYKEMKEILISQSRIHLLDSTKRTME